MMIRTKHLCLIACVLLITGLFLFALVRENRAVLKLEPLSNERFHAQKLGKLADSRRNFDGRLLADGCPVPYDALSATYYLPQNLEDSGLKGEITWSEAGYSVYYLTESFDLSQAIGANQKFELLIVNGSRYFTEHLVFTGLPSLSIHIEQEVSYVFDRGTPAGTVDVIDPSGSEIAIERCYATYRVRGNLSSKLSKVPYRVTLYDQDGNRHAAPLLNLPESDEWILNAMYSEPSRVRDKLALETWNLIADTNPEHDLKTASFSYVELFLNDRYMGLYGLMNPISGESLGLQADDVLYKASEWETPTTGALEKAQGDLDGGSTGVSIKWPRTYSGASLWDPMLQYVDIFYENRGSVPAEQAICTLDRENLIDYGLFFLMVTPRDNYFSNTYYLSRPMESGERSISRIPWDLNCSFGNCVTSTTRTHCKQDYGISQETMFPKDLELLLEAELPGLAAALAERYFALRKSVFSEKSMLDRLDESAALLSSSGAMARELARWPEGDQQPDVTPIANFIREHLQVLDAYFNAASTLDAQ